MGLKELVNSLSERKQFELAIQLINIGLPIWDRYSEKNVLEYKDTVVGLHHKVNPKLLWNTLTMVLDFLNQNTLTQFIKGKDRLFTIRERFDDPKVALQDLDWVLPREVEAIFYSVLNLLDTCIGDKTTVFGEVTLYVSISQAIEGIEISNILSFDEINAILKAFKN